MNRKVCLVTGSRAEFGLLRGLMECIEASPNLELQIVATGMHLSPEYGETYKEIESAGFSIDFKVDMLLAATSEVAITKSIGLGMIGFADALNILKPDLVIVLGDRFELIPAVTACLISRIPVAHIHGGETTEGAFDESIRHAITKMSHIHFVAAPEYARRVIQLGEHPDKVFLVGGLGVDAIKSVRLLDKNTLENELNLKFGKKNLLVTYHPVTLDPKKSQDEMQVLLDGLSELQDTVLIFTLPNADTGGSELTKMVKSYVATHRDSYVYQSLGQVKYLSCMQYVDAVVGNSSSGLLEAPSMNIGSINIGDRQKGRLSSQSVVHCEPKIESIRNALNKIFDENFKKIVKASKSPYGDGGACKNILNVIESVPLSDILQKEFYDLRPNDNDS